MMPVNFNDASILWKFMVRGKDVSHLEVLSLKSRTGFFGHSFILINFKNVQRLIYDEGTRRIFMVQHHKVIIEAVASISFCIYKNIAMKSRIQSLTFYDCYGRKAKQS